MDLCGVEFLMAKNQNEMDTEYNTFVQWPPDFEKLGNLKIRMQARVTSGTNGDDAKYLYPSVQDCTGHVRMDGQGRSTVGVCSF